MICDLTPMQLQTIETRSNLLNRQTYIFSPLFFQVSLVGNFGKNICLWRFHRWWYDVVSHLFRIWSTIRYIGEVRSENWGNGSGISSTLDTSTILYRSPTCLGHNFYQARYLAPWDHRHWHILSDTYYAICSRNLYEHIWQVSMLYSWILRSLLCSKNMKDWVVHCQQ